MKQSLVNTSTSLLREKSAASTSIIPVPELSENIEDDIYALEYYNELLDTGVPRTVAHMEALDDAGNAAQELAQKGKGNLVVIDDFINGQNQAAAAAKLSTGSIIAQSVASAALTGAISMGVTLAVNGLVMGLDYLVHAHERAVEAVDNANQAYAENETELNNASSSLAQIEERLNTLNSIQNPSLADKEETAELERQREELTAQVALLKEKGEALKAKQAESGKELMDNLESEGLDSSYSKDGGKLSWWEKIGASMAQGQTMQSASNMMLFDPDMAQQQMDMMDDMSMSAKEYAEYWTDSLSTDGLDRQSEQFQTVRDNLLNIAEEYQKVAQSSDGAIGDAAREKVNQITYALGDAETRADLFNNKLGDNDAKDKLLDAAAAGELTAENLAQIAGDDLASQLNSVSGSAQATVEQLAAMAQTGEQARSAAENLQTATASLAEANQKIADIEGAVNSQRALNASEVSDLCAKYPELQQYVTATADGFAIEEGAMSLLSGATSQFSTGYIQAQIKMSEAALAETQNRINLMQQEAGIMGSLDYATVASKTDKFVMTEHEFRRGNNSKGYESYEQYLASFLDSDLAASYEQSAKLQKAIEDAKKNLKLKQDYEKRAADTAKKNQTKSTSSGSTAYKNEALDNELKRIEHLKAIGKYENDELGYIKALENAKSRLTKKESERWQLEEKIYAAREAYEKQQLDDYLDEISYKEAMGKYDDNQAQKIADLPGNAHITNDTGDGGFIASMLWQAGATPFSVDGSTIGINMNGKNVKKFTTMWQQMLDDKLIDTSTTGWTDEWWRKLDDGSIATMLTGAWMVSSMEKNLSQTKGSWRMAPMPQYAAGEHANSENGGGALAMPKGSDDAKAKAAYEFAEWYAHGDGVQANLSQGGIPPLKSVLNDAEYLGQTDDFFGEQKTHEVIAKASKNVLPDFEYLPYMAYANSIAVDSIGQAYHGKTTLQKALVQWGDSLKTYGEQEGFTVK